MYIEPRGKSWRAVVRIGGKRKSATFDTKAEAEVWARETEKLKNLPRGPGHDITAETMFLAYLEADKSDSKQWNRYRILAWCHDKLARMPIGDITTHDIEEWLERRMEQVSGATAERELNLMGGAFSWAVKKRRWITVNPCHGAHRPERAPSRHRRLLTPEEIRAVCLATGYEFDKELRTKSARTGACFLLALETGMRSGEILRLLPEDYKKAQRTVVVAAREKGGRKGSRSGRVLRSRNVPLTQRAIELLDQLLTHPGDPYIVGLTDQQRDALWRKAIRASGVEDLHFHDAKHEAATRLSKFLDVLALSHAIGTKDLRLLRDTYYESDANAAAALLPAALAPKVGN